jgi:hypothetical protein
LSEIPGEFFYNRGFPGSSHRQVADTDDRTSYLMLALEMIPEKGKAHAHDAEIEPGEEKQEPPQYSGALACTPFQNDVDGKLFESVEEAPHGKKIMD